MTLILTLITPEFVIQASDRRLTDLSTGEPMTSRANKTVVVPPAQMMFSYTGLAQLAPGMPTDEWLMRKTFQLRESNDYMGALAGAATEAFRKIALSDQKKRHAFAVAGWLAGEFETDAALPAELGTGAFYGLISNFHDESLHELSEARADFRHLERPLYAGEGLLIFSAGAELTPSEGEELIRDVKSSLRSSGGKERAAAVVLLRALEAVSKRVSSVGGGAFVSAIPRGRFPGGGGPEPEGLSFMGMHWGLPEPDRATFVHVPDEPSETVESPGIVGDPFAGKMILRIVSGGELPSLAGSGAVPEEGSIEARLIALRSSEEIKELFGSHGGGPGS